MNRWLARQLVELDSVQVGVAVVLDADRVVEHDQLNGEVAEVSDWWHLRSAYEQHGRRRPVEAGRLTLLLQGPVATEPLPWDIERASGTVLSVRLPGPPGVRAILAELEGEEAEGAIDAVAARGDAAALVGSVAGMPLPPTPLPRGAQLRLASRLVVRPARSPRLLELASRWVDDPNLADLLRTPPEIMWLQQEWDRYARGDSGWAADFESARTELGQLFAAELLKPVVTDRNLPLWAGVGVRVPTNEELAKRLLTERPDPFPPSDQAGWVAVAEWWGTIRRLVAGGPPALRQRAWDTWAEIDSAFLSWLRSRYGVTLSSAARWPPAVHRVADHLARRMRDGVARRVLLIVVDGLGHTQWAHLRQRLTLTVVQPGSTFALVPTYTTVSRQAIFTGDLPATYPQSLWSTHPERSRWRAFWERQGLSGHVIAYHRVMGRLPHDRIEFGEARAVGVVLNAVDELMHTSELFGDAQLLANLDLWASNGFLDDLVLRADAAGFEVWITADHGNLECVATPPPSEGLAIEAAGKRLLRYPNRVLRDASTVEGIVWDDIPGLPSTAEPLRFAPGRFAYTNHQLSVSHGGLSLDEVVVPYTQVAP